MSSVRRMEKRQKDLADFGDFALRSDDLDAVLTEACRLVAEALGTGRAKVMQIEAEHHTLLVRAGVGWDEGIVGRVRLSMDEHSSETFSIAARAPVISNDLASEHRFDVPAFLKDAGVKAIASVPIFLPGGPPFGLLQVDAAEPRAFDDDDSQFLRTYATFLGPVIDRLIKATALASTESYYRAIVEAARDYAILRTDADDRITDWLAGAEAVFGWTALEAVGQPAAILFTAEDQAAGVPEREIKTALAQGSAADVRWHQRKDGSRVFIDGFVVPLRDGSGTLRGFQKIGQDVTQRHLAQEAARENEERQRFLITLGDAMRAEASADGKIHVAARLLGERLRASRVLYAEFDHARNVAEVFNGWFASGAAPFPTVMPLEDYDGSVLRALRSGVTARVDNVGLLVEEPAYAAIAAAGVQALLSVPLIVDGSLTVNVSVHQQEARRWSDSEVDLVKEVAERLWADVVAARAQAALRDSEARLRGVLDGMSEGFGLLGPDFTILEHNAEALRMDGRSREQIVGRSHWDVYPGSEHSELGRLYKKAMVERVPVALEHCYAWDSGHALWLDMRAYPTVDGGLAVFWRDITARKQAEQTLRESEQRFRSMAEAIEDVFYLADLDHDALTYLSPAYERLWGRPRSARRSALHALETVHPADHARVRQASAAQERGEPVRIEYRVMRPDGGTRWVLERSFPISNDGAGRRMAGVVSDISDGREAEERVRTTEALLRQFGDASSNILWVRDAATLQWEYLSPAFEATYGVSLADALTGETFRNWTDLIVDEDRHRAVASVQRVREGESVSFEYRIRRPDGRIRWLRDTDFPMRAEDGRIQRFGGVGEDITDFVLAQAERERSRVLLDAVLAALPTATIITDATGRPVRWNRAHEQLWGVFDRDPSSVEPFEGYAEWKGWRYPEGTPLRSRDWPLARAVTQREATADELIEIEPFDGRPRAIVLVTAAPIIRADGELLGAVVVQTDVTARLRAEEGLRRADRQKDVFLATLSHELRNPLAPIRTAAQFLTRSGLDEAQTGWALAVIQRQVGHMALLLDDLLDVSRITQGKLTLKRERVALSAIVDSAVEATRPLIDRKTHQLVVTLPEVPVHLVADPVRLSQVVANLLTNAAKYTDASGRIALDARLDGDSLALTVADTGIGIAAEALPQVFDMFAQVQGDQERADGGLGIGLALVKGLVEMHGGTVDAASPGIGHGATFTVRLPGAEVAEAGPTVSAEVAPSRCVPRKVLVADDNRDGADSLVMLLELGGHDIRVAYDGLSALTLAQSFHPDLALLDIGMPGMNGYALARALRAEPWAASLTLVAMTGWGQDDDRRRAAAAGFDLHLTKPIDPTKIEAMLSAADSLPDRLR